MKYYYNKIRIDSVGRVWTTYKDRETEALCVYLFRRADYEYSCDARCVKFGQSNKYVDSYNDVIKERWYIDICDGDQLVCDELIDER